MLYVCNKIGEVTEDFLNSNWLVGWLITHYFGNRIWYLLLMHSMAVYSKLYKTFISLILSVYYNCNTFV